MSVLAARSFKSASAKRSIRFVYVVENIRGEILALILRFVTKGTDQRTVSEVLRRLLVPTDFARCVSVEHVAKAYESSYMYSFFLEWTDGVPVCDTEQLLVLE